MIWCNSIGLRKPKWQLNDCTRAVRKVSAFMRRSEPASSNALPGLSVVHPLAIPAPRHFWTRLLNRKLLHRQINGAVQKMALEHPVLWISLPAAAPLVGAFGDLKTVYYCGDDFAALAGVDHETAAELESETGAKLRSHLCRQSQHCRTISRNQDSCFAARSARGVLLTTSHAASRSANRAAYSRFLRNTRTLDRSRVARRDGQIFARLVVRVDWSAECECPAPGRLGQRSFARSAQAQRTTRLRAQLGCVPPSVSCLCANRGVQPAQAPRVPCRRAPYRLDAISCARSLPQIDLHSFDARGFC